uniref:40S ribosomal protein S25 n=1 Tax=Megaselia scalaris TaxID=36166 RepID=T1H2E4_MEGSC
PTYDKLYKEVTQYKLITAIAVSERQKFLGSFVKHALVELRDKGLIKQVVQNHSQVIYIIATKAEE